MRDSVTLIGGEVKSRRRRRLFTPPMLVQALLAIIMTVVPSVAATAQDADAAAEMARKLQDPLASISAIMTENDILMKTGQDDVSLAFSIQPVKAWSFEKAGLNFIFRGVIPVMGLAPEAQRPIVGEPLPPGTGDTWGMGDIVTQYFFSPKTEGGWKWGAGPMVSLKTRTDSKLAGPGWGAGPVGVLVGGTPVWSFAFIGGQLWGFDGDFSTSLFQPNVYYNFPGSPGLAVAYTGQITYDWKAGSDEALTVPLGVVISKTLSIGNGYGLELQLGPYWNAVRPTGAAAWYIRYGFNVLFP